jgi:hypothetical protein
MLRYVSGKRLKWLKKSIGMGDDVVEVTHITLNDLECR